MDKGGLEEFAAVAHGEELVFAHEVVFAAVDFARTGLAGRVRDGELERRLELEKCVDERRLAGAGGAVTRNSLLRAADGQRIHWTFVFSING